MDRSTRKHWITDKTAMKNLSGYLVLAWCRSQSKTLPFLHVLRRAVAYNLIKTDSVVDHQRIASNSKKPNSQLTQLGDGLDFADSCVLRKLQNASNCRLKVSRVSNIWCKQTYVDVPRSHYLFSAENTIKCTLCGCAEVTERNSPWHERSQNLLFVSRQTICCHLNDHG